jgi:hypothetical protein
MKKIVEAAPVMPVPVETTSLPTGSFCNRCGNRVPPESAFCNRCGTPVVQETDSFGQSTEEMAVPAQQPAPPFQQVQVAPYPEAAEKKDRPIEEVIHSIEPLIEDSVPRTAPAPLVPAKQVHYAAPYDASEPTGQAPPPAAAGTADTAAQPGEVQWPVISASGIPDTAAPPGAPAAHQAPGSPPPALPPRKMSFNIKLIAVLALVVLAVIAGAYFFLHGQAATPGITPTPTITVPATTIPPTPATTAAVTTVMPTATPQQVAPSSASVPPTGVWVKVTYTGQFTGTVGTPGRLNDVVPNGGNLYQVPTKDGPVVVSIQKSDGTSAELTIEVYKDGVLMKRAATNAPKGTVEFEASLNEVTATPTSAP